MSTPRLPGRKAEARRNDERVLDAARETLADHGYDVPMSVIAQRAGVGVGSLYRRYPSKNHLVLAVAVAGMEWASDQAIRAAESEGDEWEAFVDFLERCHARRPGDLMRLADDITTSPERIAASERFGEALGALVDKVKRAGKLRGEITAADVYLLLTLLQTSDPALSRRYLALAVHGMRADSQPLPGPAPSWRDLQEMWHLRQPSA